MWIFNDKDLIHNVIHLSNLKAGNNQKNVLIIFRDEGGCKAACLDRPVVPIPEKTRDLKALKKAQKGRPASTPPAPASASASASPTRTKQVTVSLSNVMWLICAVTYHHNNINPYSAGLHFSRQNLTSTDVRF